MSICVLYVSLIGSRCEAFSTIYHRQTHIHIHIHILLYISHSNVNVFVGDHSHSPDVRGISLYPRDDVPGDGLLT